MQKNYGYKFNNIKENQKSLNEYYKKEYEKLEHKEEVRKYLQYKTNRTL